MYTKDGFYKALEQKLGDDAYILLAGGGTKKLADLLTAASLTADGNSTKLSVTVGGTTKTDSVTVPYASKAGQWYTARTLTIGSKGKSVDGSANVSWTLAEIGAAAAGHNHDGTYLKLSGGTMSGNIIFPSDKGIIQNQASTSNYTTAIIWLKGGTSQNTYNPSIGQHNTGGDGSGSICILPYATSTSPWGGGVGLFIAKNSLKWENNTIWHAGNLTKVSQLTNDKGYVTSSGVTSVATGTGLTGGTITGTGTISINSTYQTYISHGESAYNSLSNYYPVLNGSGKWSASGNGNNAYCLIAEINTNAGYINYPITFEIGGRGTVTSKVTIRFANQQAADPDCNLFATDEATCYYLYKAATNTWRLYASSPDGVWGSWYVYRVFGNIVGRITMKMETVSSLPSGYRNVTYTGNVAYASSAGSVAWGNVTSKPATATRWPTWDEVTSKPSSFTPASHTHSYLPLSGGTMNNQAVISRTGDSVAWVNGRKTPIIKTTSYTGYNSILSMKTTDGSWDLGVYTNNKAYLTYITDANYNAGTNNTTYQLIFPQKNGTLAVTGDIPTNNNQLTNGAGYVTSSHNHDSVYAKLASHNNLTASGNEFTFASSGFSGDIYLNYRTAGGTNGNITGYILGNGKGGALGTIIHSGNIGSQSVASATTASQVKDAGNGTAITFKYSTGGFTSNPTWLGAWNGYQLTYVSPSVLSVNYASSAGSASVASLLRGADNRSTNSAPSTYMSKGAASVYAEFSQSGGAASSYSGYGCRVTFTPWSDNSGGRPIQLEFNNQNVYIRGAASDSAWNSWRTIIDSSNIGSQSVASATTCSYPAGFTSRGGSDWSGVPGTFATDWSVNGADIMFKYNGSNLNVITDGRFYQGIDIYGSSKRVLDEYDISHTNWGNSDTVDGYHANRFAFTYCSANYGASSSVTVNDLVTNGVSNASHGMIYAATDNPVGTSNWVHVWSQQWTIGTTSSWVSQIALGVQQGTGMWYRTTSGNIVGRGWIRVLDSSNWSSYINPYVSTNRYPAYHANSSEGGWAYNRFTSYNEYWDIGTHYNMGYMGYNGGFEIRESGGNYNGIYVKKGTSAYGKLVIAVPNGECSLGFFNAAYGSNIWTIGYTATSEYLFGWYYGNGGGWKMTLDPNGNLTATNFYTTSDRTKKTNIESIASIVPIRKFNWKENGSLSYGFIAQELVELGHEELVHGSEGNMTVNYDAALSFSMAKLSNYVETLEHTIEELKNENNNLKSKIEDLYKLIVK